jgi:hypothetical protein
MPCVLRGRDDVNEQGSDSGAQAIVQKNPMFAVMPSNPRSRLKTLVMYREVSQHTQRADRRDKVNERGSALNGNAGERYNPRRCSHNIPSVPIEETR